MATISSHPNSSAKCCGRLMWLLLAARHFARPVIHVGNEFINGEHRHDNRCKPGSSCENQHYERRLQPDLTRSRDETLDHHRSGCQEDWIDWCKIVVLAFENDEYGERD